MADLVPFAFRLLLHLFGLSFEGQGAFATVQRCPDIERGGADLLGFGAWARQLTWVMCSICSQCRQRRRE